MRQYNFLIFSMVLFVATLLGYGYIVFALQNNISKLAVIEEETKHSVVRDEIVQSMTTFLSNIGELKNKIEKYVVDDEGVVNTIELIEQTAQRESVLLSLSSVTAVQQKGWNFHEGVEISFSASGSFISMMKFAGALEVLPLASKVEKVSFEASTKDEWFGVFTMFFVKEKI